MTLTPEQIADGWLPHDGGPCPVPLDSRPYYRVRGEWEGRPNPDLDGRCAGDFDWRWKADATDPRDIIAYKPEPTT